MYFNKYTILIRETRTLHKIILGYYCDTLFDENCLFFATYRLEHENFRNITFKSNYVRQLKWYLVLTTSSWTGAFSDTQPSFKSFSLSPLNHICLNKNVNGSRCHQYILETLSNYKLTKTSWFAERLTKSR